MSVYLGNEEDLEATMKVVDIDITKTPFENAKLYYDIRASMTEKEKKTLEATNVALKQARDAAEKKIKKKEQNIKAVKIQRKAQWYEKFYWFVSSENYLVISAKDAHQNETLIKKYLAKDDVVFHTQVQGSAFSLVKNPKGGSVPFQTLQEAAQATLCHSRCWDQKVVAEVFWVNAEQVSKTAPTGQFVGLGSFMIYGKKNFITPSRLELGFGLFFKVDEESAKNHVDERKRRDEGNEVDEDSPDRLINNSVVLSPQPGAGSQRVAKEGQEAKDEENADQDSDAAAEGSDDEDQMESTTEKLTTASSIQRQLVIDKDTECTYIKNSVTSTKKSVKSQADQKKKARLEKKATKDGKGGKAQAAKPLAEIVEEPQAKKNMSKAKKRKVEKMAAKYGEMDDDERQLQMEMMGAKNIKLSAEAKKQLDKKMREGRGETVQEEAAEVEPSESEEETVE